ncbi:MAG: type II secretion system GspH family protein [Proteobacteria bacterium]|nr:type II secretion system GspH family protein [Pseudomonadota bacterium]
MQHIIKQTGFTLIELLVVTFILAIVGGAVVVALGPDFVEQQEQTATNYEMDQVRDAVLRFMQDNPTHDLTTTTRCTPADASFLRQDGYDNDCDNTDEGTINTWDINYRLGWRGPYMSNPGATTSDEIDTDIGFDGDETTPGTPGVLQTNVPVILDAWNQPYYFFDLNDTDVARIVSTGPDLDYDSYNNAVTAGSACVAEDDDVVLCLR